ncbi:MAG: DUF3141 domain-containing protein [Desulfopila sp.]
MFNFSTFTRPADFSRTFDHFHKTYLGEENEFSQYCHDLGTILQTHSQRALETVGVNNTTNFKAFSEVWQAMFTPSAGYKLWEYLVDGSQRSVLYTDALRQRGNFFVEHEADSNKTVLIWDHEMIVDGATLPRPVNYSLVRIIPPEGVTFKEELRPYIIIDPRAGHGSGIGGFKHESEIGAAIHNGHPTYFVTFTRLPIKGQKLDDVTEAEAVFVREVARLHPTSPRPVLIGNCQGGWAAMFLAAANPDLTGPVVANGAPLSYWAGQKGKNPMRYLGGLVGGASSTRLICDLGNGLFDGSLLVSNFERLSPSNTWWDKYYHLWDRIDTEVERFVGFERWWGSFYYMTPDEINWIVDNLFVGNRPGRGTGNLNPRTHLDLRNIKSPIIIFASHGDNITPPQQALGWLADFYTGVEEIRARGQRIIYTLHDSVGHLGIFVSSSVARKEHQQIVSTLPAIEALAPGLYEMVITEESGQGINKTFTVAFAERTIDQVIEQCGGDDSDRPFATVARFSELGSELYELIFQPFVRTMVTQGSAELMAHASPMRVQRRVFSDQNPAMAPVKMLAERTRAYRKAAADDNPYRRMERFGASLVTQWWDSVRDWQNAMIEWNFHLFWDTPAIKSFGERLDHTVSSAPREDMRTLTSVQDALDRIEQGGFAEGLIRMLIFLAHSRKEVRRSRLERSNEMLLRTEPFASMDPSRRTNMIHLQTLVVGYEPEQAMQSLPTLIAEPIERRIALDLCFEIAGPVEEMSMDTIEMMNRLALVLQQPSPIEGGFRVGASEQSHDRT